MSANSFGDRGAWRDDPAWTRLGTVFHGTMKVPEAFELAGVNYKFHMGEVHATDPDGLQHLAKGRRYIMREPTKDDNDWRLIAEVSDDFEIIQHSEMADMLEGLNEVFPIETVGALYHGEDLFCSFNLGEFSVGGVDAVKMFAMLHDRKDGGHKLTVSASTWRPVCANTVALALKDAVARIDIRHYTGMRDKLAFKVEALAKVGQINAYTQSLFQRMGEVKITLEDIKNAINLVYPMPVAPEVEFGDLKAQQQFERMCQRVQGDRVGSRALYELFCEQTPSLAGTPWAGFNAVTENVNWYSNNTPDSIVFGSASKVQNSALSIFANLAR